MLPEAFYPFRHIDAFWRLCSRRLFENIVTKEDIAQNKQFLLLPQCFPLLVIGYPFNYRDFLSFDKICSKLSAAELSYEGKGLLGSNLQTFPTYRCVLTRLQQTTFENNVVKGEIIFSFIYFFPIFAKIFSKTSAADVLYEGMCTLTNHPTCKSK